MKQNEIGKKDEELLIIRRKDDTEVIGKLKEFLHKHNVEDCFVDFGQGDKFQIQGIAYNDNSHAIEFMVSKHSVRWIEMGVKHPVKLTNDE